MIDVEKLLKKCVICPRGCGVDRTGGNKGFCKAGSMAEIYAARLHFGEEPPISGKRGSGTIFFNHCNLRCAYCQNHRFSQEEDGKEFGISELAELMISLEKKGAHNINFVTPTHYAVQIANAVEEARGKGLNIPIVYNTSGYEKVDTLRTLDGLVDVYLADMRYGDDIAAKKYSSCPDYTEVSRNAIMEMCRQAGGLKLSKSGIAEKGVIIRHLILPNNIAGSEEVFKFISTKLGSDSYVSLMSQYYPANKAARYNELSRGINKKEYDDAVSLLYNYGLHNGWVQEFIEGAVDLGFAGTGIEPGF